MTTNSPSSGSATGLGAAATRPHPGWIILGLATVTFHLGLIFYGLTPALVSRPIHMALALPWILILILMARTRAERWSGWLLTLLGVAACGYIAFNEEALANQYGFIDTHFQMALGVFLIGLALETARRAIGWPLPTVALGAILYGVLGTHIPGQFGHPGMPMQSFIGSLTISEGACGARSPG